MLLKKALLCVSPGNNANIHILVMHENAKSWGWPFIFFSTPPNKTEYKCVLLIFFLRNIVSYMWSIKSFVDMVTVNLQGKKNPGTDRQSVEFFLNQVKIAKEMKIDRYILLQALT